MLLMLKRPAALEAPRSRRGDRATEASVRQRQAVAMSIFDGSSGRKPQTEARRFVYGCLASILDNGQERGENGWFGLGPDGDEFDRRRLRKALDAVRAEMLKKQART
jgi:hypothetical protein